MTCVNSVKVICIDLSPESLILNIGDTAKLWAMVFPLDAENRTVLWTSQDCNIAEVNLNTGVVTAKSAGITYIRATAVDGSDIYMIVI